MNLASGGIPDRAEVEDEAFDGPLAHHRVGIEKYFWARGRRTGGAQRQHLRRRSEEIGI